MTDNSISSFDQPGAKNLWPRLVILTGLGLVLCLAAVCFADYALVRYVLFGWPEVFQDRTTVVVADIKGPNPKSHPFSAYLAAELNDEWQGSRDRRAIVVDQSIRPEEGSEYARSLGQGKQADVVLWGYTETTSAGARLTLHVENVDPSQCQCFPLPPARLQSFTLQQNLEGEITPLIQFLSGFTLYVARDYPGAISRFTQAIDAPDWAASPSNRAYALFYRANSYYGMGAPEHAIEDYSQAIALDPEYAAAYISRGLVYDEQGQRQRAIEDYSQALVLNPEDVEAYFYRGNVHYEKRDYRRAIADYNQAIDLDPEHAYAYLNRGAAHAEQGNYPFAIADLDQAIALDPDFAEAYYKRAEVYSTRYKGRDYARAVADYRRYLELRPDAPDRWKIEAHIGALEAQMTPTPTP